MANLSDKTGMPVSIINQNTQSPIKAGTIMSFAGATTPTGWLDCDGSAKLKSAYPELFAQLSTTWNDCWDPIRGIQYTNGDALRPLNTTTEFRLPDLRGAFQRGAGGAANTAGVTTTLAGFQADTTAINGLQVTGTAPSLTGTTSFASTAHIHSAVVAPGPTTMTALFDYDAGKMWGTASERNFNFTPASARGSTPAGNPAIMNIRGIRVEGDVTGPSANASVGISGGSYSITAGNPETRPDSVGVKYIIKAFDESFNLAGFANATPTTNGLVAPRKGQYDLTPVGRVTCAQALFSVKRGVAIYYQDQDGNHRLKFNIGVNYTAVIGSVVLTIVGVTFKNVTNLAQAVSVSQTDQNAACLAFGHVNPNASTISYYYTALVGNAYVSGDVELESKPTWA